MATIFEVELSEALRWLDPVLKIWRGNIDAYITAAKSVSAIPTVPYAGTERANLSLLAGAVWQCCDGVALEEFTVQKKSRKNRGWGRGDLWISLGNNSLSIEAKQTWLTKRSEEQLQIGLTRAVNDASDLAVGGHNQLPLGLLIVVAKVRPYPERHAIDTAIGDYLALRSSVGPFDLNAAYFPDETRGMAFEDTSGKKWLWPGVFMLGRLAAKP